ncbi:MAG: 30S ribosomal protein S8 [Christensenellaceae bacterium]|jgi:small subunit ribosomal protein S8|nr:30S ribosomal protein S8 [Christensenellaceae bacterium]
MITTDPIADMLTRIRNAIMARKESVLVPMSKMKTEIAKILQQEGYIESYSNTVEGNKKMINIIFKLHGGKQKVIQGLKRISKPGLRVYSTAHDMPRVLSGLGIAIVSTSGGIMTDKQAREKNLGGEVLAYVW